MEYGACRGVYRSTERIIDRVGVYGGVWRCEQVRGEV